MSKEQESFHAPKWQCQVYSLLGDWENDINKVFREEEARIKRYKEILNDIIQSSLAAGWTELWIYRLEYLNRGLMLKCPPFSTIEKINDYIREHELVNATPCPCILEKGDIEEIYEFEEYFKSAESIADEENFILRNSNLKKKSPKSELR
jgi:hypothetical protein